ncbi:MAG: hypothetical protein ACHQ53_07430 [Polyangiales bacterium]
MQRSTERFALLVLLIAVACCGSQRALAQSDPHVALAEAWVDAAVQQQSGRAEISRYLGGPIAAAGGVALLVAPPFTNMRPEAKALYMGAGGLFFTAAIGLWASPDYEAARWYTRFGSLAFVALGGGAMLSRSDGCNVDPFSSDAGCSARRRRLDRAVFTIELVETGFFLSNLLLDLVMPPSSPTALRRELRSLRPEQRFDHVIDFLQQRERRERTASYVTLPAYFALGGATIWLGTGAATTEGRVLVYGLGIGVVALGVAALVYQVVHVPDWQRLERGEGPGD